jgi:hypothetical protein
MRDMTRQRPGASRLMVAMPLAAPVTANGQPRTEANAAGLLRRQRQHASPASQS